MDVLYAMDLEVIDRDPEVRRTVATAYRLKAVHDVTGDEIRRAGPDMENWLAGRATNEVVASILADVRRLIKVEVEPAPYSGHNRFVASLDLPAITDKRVALLESRLRYYRSVVQQLDAATTKQYMEIQSLREQLKKPCFGRWFHETFMGWLK